MKEADNWENPNEYPAPPNPDADNRLQQEQLAGFEASPSPGYPQGRMPEVRRKRKWIAGLLAFLIPGIGHMYLGLMVKGIVLMLLVALDITAIVYVSIEVKNVLSIVLLSLLLPIIYFYNLFDAIQSTDAVNDRQTAAAAGNGRGWGEQNSKPSLEESFARNVPPVGILVVAGAGIVILVMAGTNWTDWLFNSFGSMLGAVVLIGAGIGLWFWETKGHQGKRN